MAFIRGGGTIGKLEGVPLDPGPDHFETDEDAAAYREVKEKVKKAAAAEDFLPFSGLRATDAPPDVLDEISSHGDKAEELLAAEKGVDESEMEKFSEMLVSAAARTR